MHKYCTYVVKLLLSHNRRDTYFLSQNIPGVYFPRKCLHFFKMCGNTVMPRSGSITELALSTLLKLSKQISKCHQLIKRTVKLKQVTD